MDDIHGSVAFMSNDVAAMAVDLGTMDDTVIGLSANIHDMRQSFEFMEQNVGRMGADVNQLSQPMRMFNFFNPFR
jgi:archaellum component FlaC